jgi:hypothetical protein
MQTNREERMTKLSLGTVIGRSSTDEARTITVALAPDGLEMVSSTLERRNVPLSVAPSVEQIVTAARQAFALQEARFIPAHGATGGKSTDEHLASPAG